MQCHKVSHDDEIGTAAYSGSASAVTQTFNGHCEPSQSHHGAWPATEVAPPIELLSAAFLVSTPLKQPISIVFSWKEQSRIEIENANKKAPILVLERIGKQKDCQE